MKSDYDAILASLEDTQPITVTTEVFHDDCGWWEQFGRAASRDADDEFSLDLGLRRPPQ